MRLPSHTLQVCDTERDLSLSLSLSSTLTIPSDQMEGKLAFHMRSRDVAIDNLRGVHAQLSAFGPRGPHAAQPLLYAEHQLRMHISLHETEIMKIRQAMAVMAQPGIATAERRALQLQSGQMYATIKV